MEKTMTAHGDKLRSIRDQAIAAGVPLLSVDEVLEERKRRLIGEEEPLPCPFCGIVPDIFYTTNLNTGESWYVISCQNEDCSIETLEASSEFNQAEAIAAWNRRA